jgi:hypothetical protein
MPCLLPDFVRGGRSMPPALADHTRCRTDIEGKNFSVSNLEPWQRCVPCGDDVALKHRNTAVLIKVSKRRRGQLYPNSYL